MAARPAGTPRPRGRRREGQGRPHPLGPGGHHEGEVQAQPVQPHGQRHDIAEQVADRRQAGGVSFPFDFVTKLTGCYS